MITSASENPKLPVLLDRSGRLLRLGPVYEHLKALDGYCQMHHGGRVAVFPRIWAFKDGKERNSYVVNTEGCAANHEGEQKVICEELAAAYKQMGITSDLKRDIRHGADFEIGIGFQPPHDATHWVGTSQRTWRAEDWHAWAWIRIKQQAKANNTHYGSLVLIWDGDMEKEAGGKLKAGFKHRQLWKALQGFMDLKAQDRSNWTLMIGGGDKHNGECLSDAVAKMEEFVQWPHEPVISTDDVRLEGFQHVTGPRFVL